MRLYWSTSSPFARKVGVVLCETGLLAQVEEVECDPFSDPLELRAYLDSLSPLTTLIPAGPAQWAGRRTEALADGLLDLAARHHGRAASASFGTVARHDRTLALACSLAIDEMQRALAELPEPFSLTHIAIACACGYLDFRPGDGSYDRFPKAERRSNVDIRRP